MIDDLIKRIKKLTPNVSSLEHWQETAESGNGKEYAGEFLTPLEVVGLQALTTELITLRALVAAARRIEFEGGDIFHRGETWFMDGERQIATFATATEAFEALREK